MRKEVQEKLKFYTPKDCFLDNLKLSAVEENDDGAIQVRVTFYPVHK